MSPTATAAALRISPALALPLGVANKTICIFGKGGSGKSNLEVVLAEELFHAGIPTCIVDPADIHYGIKSARDGKSGGLPFIVFGGLHADHEIYPDMGVVMADVFLDQGLFMVIVTQQWTGGERSRFMTDFANQLYKRGPEKEQRGSARVLILEEAHEYVPLNPGKGEEVMLGAMKRLYTVSRNYWIGFIAATRRPAKMHTDLRNGADITAFFQIVGTQDRKAMVDYLGEVATREDRDEILPNLAKLPVGTAYFYQPHEEPALLRVMFRHRSTLDTTTTDIPVGHKAIQPVLAKVDLSKLGDALAAAREKAKADDPRELRKRIQQLQRDLEAERKRLTPTRTVIEEKVVEVPVLDVGQVREIQAAIEGWAQANADRLIRGLDDVVAGVIKRYPAQLKGRTVQPAVGAGAMRSAAHPHSTASAAANPPGSTARPVRSAANAAHVISSAVSDGNVKLGAGERKVLAVLAQWPDGRSQRDVAFLTGYSAKASTIGVILSNLRRGGLVEPGQPVKATAEGLAAAGGVEELPSGPELLEHWMRHPRIGEGERKVLRALIEAYPAALTHAELCDRTNYSQAASTIGVILSKLRKLGLVEAGLRRVPDSFMEAIA